MEGGQYTAPFVSRVRSASIPVRTSAPASLFVNNNNFFYCKNLGLTPPTAPVGVTRLLLLHTPTHAHPRAHATRCIFLKSLEGPRALFHCRMHFLCRPSISVTSSSQNARGVVCKSLHCSPLYCTNRPNMHKTVHSHWAHSRDCNVLYLVIFIHSGTNILHTHTCELSVLSVWTRPL